jgi:RNA polymerase sigma factor (sigma-70 family)
MSSTKSVTHLIEQLKETGDQEAVRILSERYFERLRRLARKHLQRIPRREADEDDVAQSAFISFWRGATQGRFTELRDRDDLWSLLVVITVRKALDQVERTLGPKQGGGKVRGDSALPGAGIRQVLGQAAPTPEHIAQSADEIRHLLSLLEDDKQRSIALWSMEGYTNREIAAKGDCAVRTVERTLNLIREVWGEEIGK